MSKKAGLFRRNLFSSKVLLRQLQLNFWVVITVPERLFGVQSVDFGRKRTVYRRLFSPWLAKADSEIEKFSEWVELAARALGRIGRVGRQ
jgi:hypothetical protein